LVDLNGDGYQDLLSGSWPGELFWFRGGPDRAFAAPEMLQDQNGDYINIGGGIREQPDGGVLITGHGEFEKDDEGQYALYHGKKIRSTAEKPVSITGTASAVHAYDWDGDGDLDLLVGDIGGNVYLVPNEGTATAFAFGKERRVKADGKFLHVPGDAGPFVADWDGDGRFDLLVGAGDGSVTLYRNTGSATKPELAQGVHLVPPGETTHGSDAPKEPRRGTRSKVCVADWNGDGSVDLLVGDFATQQPDLPEPTAEERASHGRLRAELETIQARYGKLINKLHGSNRVRETEALEQLRTELQAVSSQMQELREKLPPEYENHGWIWLFQRRPGAASGNR
jgi:hypothetical protein